MRLHFAKAEDEYTKKKIKKKNKQNIPLRIIIFTKRRV